MYVCMYDYDYDYARARVCALGANPSVCAIAFSFAEQSVYFMKTLTREREQPSLGRRGFGGAGYASPESNFVGHF